MVATGHVRSSAIIALRFFRENSRIKALILPGFGKKLKKPNGTDAGRAFFRCIFTLMNIAAVAAAPDPFFVPVEYPAGFEVVCKGQKRFFMLLFRN